MSKINTRKIGDDAERTAAAYLEKQGVRIVEKNFRNRRGEIDLIGYQESVLVFFEVKYRRSQRAGIPEAAVNFRKQKQICRVADFYRLMHKVPVSTQIRYDVLAIEGQEFRWIRNAFAHIYV